MQDFSYVTYVISKQKKINIVFKHWGGGGRGFGEAGKTFLQRPIFEIKNYTKTVGLREA